MPLLNVNSDKPPTDTQSASKCFPRLQTPLSPVEGLQLCILHLSNPVFLLHSLRSSAAGIYSSYPERCAWGSVGKKALHICTALAHSQRAITQTLAQRCCSSCLSE